MSIDGGWGSHVQRTPFEVWMGGVDTSINNVSTCSFPCAVIVGISRAAWFAIGDACKAPFGVFLLNERHLVHYAVLLDVLHLKFVVNSRN